MSVVTYSYYGMIFLTATSLQTYSKEMDIDDQTLAKLSRISPHLVPITKIGRCLKLLDDVERIELLSSLTKRRPRNDRERRILLFYAQISGAGGLLFIDALGGFEGQRLC